MQMGAILCLFRVIPLAQSLQVELFIEKYFLARPSKFVIKQDLSLSQIKTPLKELTPVTWSEMTVSDRLISVARDLREREGLDDPKKQRRLEKLLQDLESLLED